MMGCLYGKGPADRNNHDAPRHPAFIGTDGMTRYPNPYYALGTILFLIGIAAYLGLSVRETAIMPVCLGCSMFLRGASLGKKLRTEESARDRIMGMSFVLPGSVQICEMGRKATGAAMIATYVACYLVLASLMFSFVTVEDVGDRMFATLLTYSLVFLFADMVLCSIQSNEYCNRRGLPYIGGEFEGHWTNTALAYRLTVLAISIFSVAMAVLILRMR